MLLSKTPLRREEEKLYFNKSFQMFIVVRMKQMELSRYRL
jgi:hypothetical protein